MSSIKQSGFPGTQRTVGTARPVDVAIVDGSGDQITSFGGGTQYTEGATDASITGGAVLAEGAGDTLTPLQVDASANLKVVVASALPAGTNAIGKLSANSGVDIGDVDVTSLPALATGDNTVGRVKLSDGTDVADILDLANSNPLTVAIVNGTGDQITSFGGGTQYTEGDTDTTITGTAMLWEDTSDTLRSVSAAKPLPVNVVAGSTSGTEYTEGDTDATITGTALMLEDAGNTLVAATGTVANGLDVDVTRVGGNVTVINAGTFAVQVDGSALTALQLIDDPVFQDDVGFTPGTHKVMMVGFEADESSTDSVDEGDAGAARITLDRKQIVADYAHTAGGASNYTALSTAAVLAAEIKGSAGQVYDIECFNDGANEVFMRLYNQTGAPATTDTANIVWRGMIPGNAAGAGFTVTFPKGRAFATGIGIRVTGAVADNDATALTANEVMVNIGYK